MTKPQYQGEHPRARAAWQPLVDAGQVTCRRCNQPITPTARPAPHVTACRDRDCTGDCWDQWDLGHGVAYMHGGDGTDSQPEHSCCNRAAGGRLNRQARASRNWHNPH